MSAVKDKPADRIITKSFRFEPRDAPADGAEAPKKKVQLEVNDTKFDLADDLFGFELLQYVAASETTHGIVRLMQRVVSDEDWPKYLEAVRYAQPQDFGRMAAQVLDAYASFPTTPGGDSSGG